MVKELESKVRYEEWEFWGMKFLVEPPKEKENKNTLTNKKNSERFEIMLGWGVPLIGSISGRAVCSYVNGPNASLLDFSIYSSVGAIIGLIPALIYLKRRNN